MRPQSATEEELRRMSRVEAAELLEKLAQEHFKISGLQFRELWNRGELIGPETGVPIRTLEPYERLKYQNTARLLRYVFAPYRDDE
jgi:hypothetical protein